MHHNMDNFADIFLNKRDQISKFLCKGNNNEYNILLPKLKEFEVKHASLNKGIYNLNEPIINKYSFYQLPTHEMISCIIDICKDYKINKLIEVAAGCGLISDVINNKYKNSITVTASDINNDSFGNLKDKYGDVKTASFKDINDTEPVLISWLHEVCQNDFIEMIERNRPKFIIHIGEGPDGCCYNNKFIPKLNKLGYEFQIIPVMMLSRADYFKDDKIRSMKNYEYSRTCITLLTLIDDNYPIYKNKSNLHSYVKIDEEYAVQDIKVFRQQKKDENLMRKFTHCFENAFDELSHDLGSGKSCLYTAMAEQFKDKLIPIKKTDTEIK